MKIEMTSNEFADMIRTQRALIQEHNTTVMDLNRRIDASQKSLRETQDKLYDAQSKYADRGYEIEGLKEDLRVQKIHTETAKAQPPDPTIVAKILQDLLQSTMSGNKIDAIKNVRTLTGFGLKEAKDLYESAVEKKQRAA